MRYSVIIPTLNEELEIADCIESVRRLNPDAEIIVADGNSTDTTVDIARRHGARTCQSPRGRGRQCNAGAAIATGDILIFLHVDTVLPGNAFQVIEETFYESHAEFGVFKLAFDVRHWFLNTLPLLVRPHLPFLRFGDQCFVIRRSFFESLGGFPGQSMYEDTALARKANRRTRIRVFPAAVTTSARRFIRNGPVRQLFHDGFSLFRYLAGADTEKLAASYRSMKRRSSSALIAMARKPEPEKVKTRLTNAVGPEAAADIYRITADSVFRAMKKCPGVIDRYLALSDADHPAKWSRTWLSPPFYYIAQRGNDLGERLTNAARTAFRHGADHAVLLATDVPDLGPDILARAVEDLARYDIVLGPSPDGGYYLLAMNHVHEELFRNIDWGSEKVTDQTLAAASRAELSVGLLPELPDIDTVDDLSRWMDQADRRHPLYRFLRRTVSPEARRAGQTAGYTGETSYQRQFSSLLGEHQLTPRPETVETLWVNITRKCNQACTHCHVAASPQRTERMDRATMDACLSFLERNETCTTLDITGGAPELHPGFEYLVTRARALGKRVIVRTNLTVFLEDDANRGGGMDHLPDFYAANRVELIASLPHYNGAITARTRGEGVHQASLQAIEALNRRGYGEGELVLNLMHNAEGPMYPADRDVMERAYREELDRCGLRFDELYTVTNVPIARYRHLLERTQGYTSYMERLVAAFSPDSVANLSCRSLVSVGPDGTLYDCDFNQMLDIPVVRRGEPLTIHTAGQTDLLAREIRFTDCCFGCTAGGGSS